MYLFAMEPGDGLCETLQCNGSGRNDVEAFADASARSGQGQHERLRNVIRVDVVHRLHPKVWNLKRKLLLFKHCE